MSLSSIWLSIDGYAATEIAAHTPPTWETWADGGTGKITCEFALSPRAQHQLLRPDVTHLVQVMCGPMPVASGIMDYYDRNNGSVTAYGLAAAGRKYLALDGGGNGTRDTAVAIATAQGAGWPVVNANSVTGVAAGDATGNPAMVADLLDDRAEQLGQRWGVNGDRRLFMRADPTEPMWLAAPDSSAFGATNENQAKTLKGRYLDSSTSTFQTATAGTGGAPQATVDLTQQQAMTNAQAVTILNGMLTKGRSQNGWTNGVVLSRDQLQTLGGTPAFLPSVRAGQMARSFGLPYATQAFALDTVIGLTRYTAGDPTIYVEPVNLAETSTPFAA